MNASPLAVVAAATVGVQVGAAIVATRFAVADLSPGAIALLRYAIGALCLLPVFLRVGRVPFARGDLLPVLGLGVLQFGVLIALLNASLAHLTAARAALIFATLPMLTMLLAAALGRETLTPRRSLGVLLALIGVALSLSETLFEPGDSTTIWIGVGLALASTATGAVCSVFYRPYLQRYPTVQVSFIAMLGSVVALAGLAGWEGFFTAPLPASPKVWSAVLFIGVSSGIGFVAWLYALRHAPATVVTLFLSLSPITAAIIGVIALDEPLTLGLAAGLVVVLAGLWLALRPAGVKPTDDGSAPAL